MLVKIKWHKKKTIYRTKIECWTLQYNDFDGTCIFLQYVKWENTSFCNKLNVTYVYLQYVEFHMRLFSKNMDRASFFAE